MADNVYVRQSDDEANRVLIATDEIGGVHYQRVKIGTGADGAYNDLVLGQATMAQSLPVVLASDQNAMAVSGPVVSIVQLSSPFPDFNGNDVEVGYTQGGWRAPIEADYSTIAAPTIWRIPYGISGYSDIMIRFYSSWSLAGGLKLCGGEVSDGDWSHGCVLVDALNEYNSEYATNLHFISRAVGYMAPYDPEGWASNAVYIVPTLLSPWDYIYICYGSASSQVAAQIGLVIYRR